MPEADNSEYNINVMCCKDSMSKFQIQVKVYENLIPGLTAEIASPVMNVLVKRMVLDGNNNCIELNECETINGGCWVNDPMPMILRKLFTNLFMMLIETTRLHANRTCECPKGSLVMV